jgi:hypothetical protein
MVFHTMSSPSLVNAREAVEAALDSYIRSQALGQEQLGASQLADQVRDFRALAVAFLPVGTPKLVIERFRTMPADAVVAEIEEMQNALYELLPRLLPKLVLPLRIEVPIGVKVQSPLGLKVRLTIGERRRMIPELVGMRTDSLALAMLDDLFRRPRSKSRLWLRRTGLSSTVVRIHAAGL